MSSRIHSDNIDSKKSITRGNPFSEETRRFLQSERNFHVALNHDRNRTRRALVDRKTTERDFLIGMREFPPGDSQFVPKQFTELGNARARRGASGWKERENLWMKERSTRTSATREMDSGERLEDNAIIRNYRVRPRLAELSHSVSITGPASLWAPSASSYHWITLSLSLYSLHAARRSYLYTRRVHTRTFIYI